MQIILASRSPRRRELLTMLGLDYEILIPEGEEVAPQGLEPGPLVAELSRQKAAEIAAQRPEALVIAADTMVFLEGRRLGKPRDAAEAAEMLSALSGRSHLVCTGVTLRQGERVLSRWEETEVRFRDLTAAEIAAYVANGEPLDKAGSYGAQGLGALLVEGIRGDFFNVMGLPVCLLGQMLGEFGVQVLKPV